MSDITTGIGDLALAQQDGGLPTTLAAGSAPGESGLAVINVRFQGSFHLTATLRRHLVCFQWPLVRQTPFECRMADRRLSHQPPAGSLAICPAGIDCAADAEGSVDAILVAIEPRQLALAAAEDSALEAQLIERLSGYDQALLDLARLLALESVYDYPNGPLFWNEVASTFIDGLIAGHTSVLKSRSRGLLGKDVLERIKGYVVAHLGEPIEVAALAKLAGRSPFHFSRVFSRSVGMSPHRYVVHLRLQRAIELVRDGRSGLAEIAAHTGFADQSHLSRWVRRVHGVPLTQLVA
jgi:AraC family transcriptional regulator